MAMRSHLLFFVIYFAVDIIAWKEEEATCRK
jgi:hypothetical protein